MLADLSAFGHYRYRCVAALMYCQPEDENINLQFRPLNGMSLLEYFTPWLCGRS